MAEKRYSTRKSMETRLNREQQRRAQVKSVQSGIRRTYQRPSTQPAGQPYRPYNMPPLPSVGSDKKKKKSVLSCPLPEKIDKKKVPEVVELEDESSHIRVKAK